VAFGRAAGEPRQSALSLAKSSDQPNQQSTDSNNNTKSMRNKTINYIRAGYPGLYLVSHEEQIRASLSLKAVTGAISVAWILYI
jgi:hypothetical protein